MRVTVKVKAVVPLSPSAWLTLAMPSAGSGLKSALTARAWFIVTVHGSVVQSPLQPVKVKPTSATAVRVTTVLSMKLAVHVRPQSIPAGVLVTVPLPMPVFPTVSGYSRVSQASPTPSPSLSAWSGLGTAGQLSLASGTPSPSPSGGGASQASPTPLPSLSVWSGLGAAGQLSQASPTPSPSPSACVGLGVTGQLSLVSSMPSLSVSVASGYI